MNIVTTTVKLRYDCISAKKTVEGKFLKFTPILLIKKTEFQHVLHHTNGEFCLLWKQTDLGVTVYSLDSLDNNPLL